MLLCLLFDASLRSWNLFLYCVWSFVAFVVVMKRSGIEGDPLLGSCFSVSVDIFISFKLFGFYVLPILFGFYALPIFVFF